MNLNQYWDLKKRLQLKLMTADLKYSFHNYKIDW
jgi:hypothetical protein